MLFVAVFRDAYEERPDLLEVRAREMPVHLAFLDANADEVIASGALRTSPGGTPLGAIWIVAAPDRARVEALYRDDPFWKAGLRKSVAVYHWDEVAWSPHFTRAMAALEGSHG